MSCLSCCLDLRIFGYAALGPAGGELNSRRAPEEVYHYLAVLTLVARRGVESHCYVIGDGLTVELGGEAVLGNVCYRAAENGVSRVVNSEGYVQYVGERRVVRLDLGVEADRLGLIVKDLDGVALGHAVAGEHIAYVKALGLYLLAVLKLDRLVFHADHVVRRGRKIVSVSEDENKETYADDEEYYYGH